MAAYSFVKGDKSLFATYKMSLGGTILSISTWPKWIKVLNADVPFKSKNTSSDFKTYSNNFGKTAIILVKSDDYLSLVFLSNEHKRSITCYRILLSTI